MIYNREFETMPRADLEQLQTERLQATLNRVYRNVAFYRDLFDAQKIDIEKVRSVRDLGAIPFTTREDLRKAYPYDMFARPLRDIVRIHATSGTTGRPIVTGYTRNDITNWSELIARQLASVGITEHDVVQVAFRYGLFTGGLGFHYGAERIGASVIPSSPAGDVAEQNQIMKDYKATALVTMPSYATAMANFLPGMSITPSELFLKVGIFGAEPWSEAVRSLLEEKLHIKAYDCYGVGELMGPGLAGECTEKNGLHVNEDHFIVEVVDPTSRTPLPPGATGELVFTTITREGFPLVRYRTGDLACLLEGACPCGRALVRMSRVQGRTDDMIFCQGAKLFPSQVQEVLLAVDGIEPDYEVVLDRENGLDTMEVKVAISAGVTFFDDVRKLVQLKNEVARQLESRLGVKARVSYVEAGSLRAKDGGKRRPVVDRRKD
jgi:phenylacetate-CoA ligase